MCVAAIALIAVVSLGAQETFDGPIDGITYGMNPTDMIAAMQQKGFELAVKKANTIEAGEFWYYFVPKGKKKQKNQDHYIVFTVGENGVYAGAENFLFPHNRKGEAAALAKWTHIRDSLNTIYGTPREGSEDDDMFEKYIAWDVGVVSASVSMDDYAPFAMYAKQSWNAGTYVYNTDYD